MKEATKPKPATDWLALIKQAKEKPTVSEPSPEKDDLSDLSDNETETSRTKDGFTKSTSETPSTYCGSAMRGVIGKPYKLDFAEKSPNKYDNSNPKAFHTTPKNKTALQSSSKSFSNLFNFPNRAFCSTPKDEMRSASMLHSLRPASASSKTKTKGSSFLRHVGRDHGSSRNNKGFADENKSSPSKYNPRIVITNEDGDARKIDEKSSTRGVNVEVVNTRIYI